MPKKVLIATVGGSCDPIVNAIREGGYDKVYFVCTSGGRSGSEKTVDGSGRPCGPDERRGKPSIVEQTGLLPEQYEKHLLSQEEMDDLDLCYKSIKDLGNRISGDCPDCEVVANFTGGTKTMSAALVLAAMSFSWRLALNQGVRRDLRKVHSGDIEVQLSVNAILEDRYVSLLEKAFSVKDYSMADAVCSEFLKKITEPDMRRRWIELKNFSEGFALWDGFYYEDALGRLDALPKMAGPWLGILRNLTRKDRQEHGYLVVFDLLNNAERRAGQSRFDDAVSRLYRATELLAQTRLQEKYGLESGNLSLDDLRSRISEALLEQYARKSDEKGLVKLGLLETYRLLSRLGDEVGELFINNEKRILDALSTRNYSFLAHGFNPIGKEAYERVSAVLEGFICEAIKAVHPQLQRPRQFSGEEIIEGGHA